MTFYIELAMTSSKGDINSVTQATAILEGPSTVFIMFSADSSAWRIFRDEDHFISLFSDVNVFLYFTVMFKIEIQSVQGRHLFTCVAHSVTL